MNDETNKGIPNDDEREVVPPPPAGYRAVRPQDDQDMTFYGMQGLHERVRSYERNCENQDRTNS